MKQTLVCQWQGARGNGLSAVSAKIALHEYKRRFPIHNCIVEPLWWDAAKYRVAVYQRADGEAKS